MKMTLTLATLLLCLHSYGAPIYHCDVTGIIEYQKKPLLSNKWKTDTSNRAHLCSGKSAALDLSLLQDIKTACKGKKVEFNYQLVIKASEVTHDGLHLSVDLSKTVGLTFENGRRGTILKRDISFADTYEEEVTVDFPMVTDKRKRSLLKTVRLICELAE